MHVRVGRVVQAVIVGALLIGAGVASERVRAWQARSAQAMALRRSIRACEARAVGRPLDELTDCGLRAAPLINVYRHGRVRVLSFGHEGYRPPFVSCSADLDDGDLVLRTKTTGHWK